METPALRSSSLLPLLPVLLVCAGAAPALGQQCTHVPDQRLLASDGATDDLFGRSVAVDGDTAIVGALSAGTGGAAYVFVRTGGVWVEQAKLLPSSPQSGEGFGFSVGISGNTAVVGAPFHDTAAGANAGAAFVFVRNGATWTQKTMLSASDGGPSHHYGGAVAIDAARIAVGASAGNHPGGTGGGAAYAYELISLPPFGAVWALDQKLVPNDVAGSFGRSIAVRGSFVAVGAPYSDTSAGVDSGAVYVFERDDTDWSQDVKLVGTADAGHRVGYRIAFDGGRIAALAMGDDTVAPVGGAAHVFRKQMLLPPSTAHFWMHDGKLVNPEVAPNAGVTSCVALSTGMVHLSTGLSSLAVVWTWEKQGGAYARTFKTRVSPGEFGDSFGFELAGDGTDLFATAMTSDAPGSPDQGAAYWIDASYPGVCAPVAYCTAKTTSNGCVPQIGGLGFPSASSASGFHVRATELRNNRPGLLLYVVGGARTATPFQGGTLCVGPSSIRRTIGVVSGGSPAPANDCSGVFTLDVNAFAHGALGGNPDPGLLDVGAVVRGQWWGRDPGFAAPNNTMLSDALEWIVAP